MKILLDECVDNRLAAHIPGHKVSTVAAKGRTGITNGKLLTLAQAEFDVLVTVDRKLSFQQHLPKFNVAVILIISKWNRIEDLIALGPWSELSRQHRGCPSVVAARRDCEQ